MNIRLSLFMLLLVGITSCSTQKHTTSNSNQFTTGSGPDGSSYEKAIVIQETREKPGVDAEYAWLKAHYPGYKLNGQALNFKDKKPFDILNIKTANGETKAIYFDISNFFGKF